MKANLIAVRAKDEMMPCQVVALSHTDAIEAAVTEQHADTGMTLRQRGKESA